MRLLCSYLPLISVHYLPLISHIIYHSFRTLFTSHCIDRLPLVSTCFTLHISFITDNGVNYHWLIIYFQYWSHLPIVLYNVIYYQQRCHLPVRSILPLQSWSLPPNSELFHYLPLIWTCFTLHISFSADNDVNYHRLVIYHQSWSHYPSFCRLPPTYHFPPIMMLITIVSAFTTNPHHITHHFVIYHIIYHQSWSHYPSFCHLPTTYHLPPIRL